MGISGQERERLSAVNLAEAVRRAATHRTSTDTLASVIEMATNSGPCDGASVTMLGKNRSLTTVASSDELITRNGPRNGRHDPEALPESAS